MLTAGKLGDGCVEILYHLRSLPIYLKLFQNKAFAKKIFNGPLDWTLYEMFNHRAHNAWNNKHPALA